MLLHRQAFRKNILRADDICSGAPRQFYQNPIDISSPYHTSDKNTTDGCRRGLNYVYPLSAVFKGRRDCGVVQCRVSSSYWSTIAASISCREPSTPSRNFINYKTSARVRRAVRSATLPERETFNLEPLSRNAQTPAEDRTAIGEFDSSSQSGKGADLFGRSAGSQSDIASMSTESDVGIICFVNSCIGFQGVLKQRYACENGTGKNLCASKSSSREQHSACCEHSAAHSHPVNLAAFLCQVCGFSGE